VWPSGTLLLALMECSLGGSCAAPLEEALRGSESGGAAGGQAAAQEQQGSPQQQLQGLELQLGQEQGLGQHEHERTALAAHAACALHTVAIPIVYGSSWAYD
jgi:hypothetical protein